jgi:hypothetical protein
LTNFTRNESPFHLFKRDKFDVTVRCEIENGSVGGSDNPKWSRTSKWKRRRTAKVI